MQSKQNWGDLQSPSSESHKAKSISETNAARTSAYMFAIPSNSTTHQSTRTLRIHTLYLVIRNFFRQKRSCPRTTRCTVPRVLSRFRALRALWQVRSKPCRAWPEPWEAHERGMKEIIITTTTARFRSTMMDWHQACCRKRPLRASRAPTNRPTPWRFRGRELHWAARGAAVSRKAFINRLSPRRIPTAFPSLSS